ncbi:hypothetical protein BE21_09545 [Sorangium cellulosum]|uniref:Uncharacterized protein n=1 Tax=Sorangium cellulosum TaxID=56 RepID=A0A150U230_SORCE|nr:hypothetical protein BE21_09545 [Sorangium cellulosum]
MAAATNRPAEAQQASGGISLAQYAAVKAAVAEGFPLADVLATEGLEPRAFMRADLAWKQRLVAEPELLTAYELELAQAEDWLERSVEPLAEDAAAWARFLAAFEAHPAPLELLHGNDLGMNDVARLRRRWARRAEEDAKIGELLVELRAKPAKLEPLRVGSRALRPSRVAEARAPAKAPEGEPSTAEPSSEPDMGLAEYSALCAELEALPEQRERVLRRHGLADDEALAALHRRWQAALERDAALAKDLKRLQEHHARRLEMLLARARDVADVESSIAPLAASPAPSTPPSREAMAGPSAPLVTPEALHGTGPLLDVPRAAVVPFGPAQGELATARVEPKPPRATESLTGAALPFPRTSASATVKRPPPVVAETGPLLRHPRRHPSRNGRERPGSSRRRHRCRLPRKARRSPLPERLPRGLPELRHPRDPPHKLRMSSERRR